MPVMPSPASTAAIYCQLTTPLGASDELKELWRSRVIKFYTMRKMINVEFASNLLGWRHSGFSIESGTRIYDDSARGSLSQYLVRAPVSLEKITWDSRTDTVTWKAPRTGPHKGKEKYFSGPDFEAEEVTNVASRKASARLLAKVYEIDVLRCPKCGGRMSVIAVIRDLESIREIIACMDSKGRGHGRGPP